MVFCLKLFTLTCRYSYMDISVTSETFHHSEYRLLVTGRGWESGLDICIVGSADMTELACLSKIIVYQYQDIPLQLKVKAQSVFDFIGSKDPWMINALKVQY